MSGFYLKYWWRYSTLKITHFEVMDNLMYMLIPLIPNCGMVWGVHWEWSHDLMLGTPLLLWRKHSEFDNIGTGNILYYVSHLLRILMFYLKPSVIKFIHISQIIECFWDKTVSRQDLAQAAQGFYWTAG